MNKTNQIIAIDIDDVLAPTTSCLANWHNRVYKTNLTVEDFHSFQWWDVWGGTEDEAIAKAFEFFKSDDFFSMKPIAGSVEAIRQLSKKFDLAIVTARQNIVKEQTLIWIERHYPNCFTNVMHGNHHSHEGEVFTKPEMCQNIGATIFIDDVPNHALACAELGLKVFLFGDYPWNRSVDTLADVIRVKNWKEIIAKLIPK
jgi:5'(3')-deoxyribonucleotidase